MTPSIYVTIGLHLTDLRTMTAVEDELGLQIQQAQDAAAGYMVVPNGVMLSHDTLKWLRFEKFEETGDREIADMWTPMVIAGIPVIVVDEQGRPHLPGCEELQRKR